MDRLEYRAKGRFSQIYSHQKTQSNAKVTCMHFRHVALFFWTTPLISCYAAEQCVLNGRGGESDRADYNLYVACLADPSMQYVLELDDSELVK